MVELDSFASNHMCALFFPFGSVAGYKVKCVVLHQYRAVEGEG